MKKITNLLIITILFLYSGFSFAQKTIQATLNVDTQNLTFEDTSKYCQFEGQSKGMSVADYSINAKKGDLIVWKATSTSSKEDLVKIISIKYNDGINIFEKDKILGKNGVVKSKVMNETSSTEDYNYTISFKVMTKGSLKPGTYHIASKIKI